MGPTPIRMEASMRGSFTKISRTAMELKFGLMEPSTLVSIKMERKMDMEYLSGLMEAPMKENSLKIILKETVQRLTFNNKYRRV